MQKFMITLFALALNKAFAHGGGVDKAGCHMQKNVGRHCHGVNAGKYIPEPEEKRIARQRKETCNSHDADGEKIRHDFQGKPCRNRTK